jgi:hypothetical protein
MLPLNVSKQSMDAGTEQLLHWLLVGRVLPWPGFLQDRLSGNGGITAALIHRTIVPHQICNEVAPGVPTSGIWVFDWLHRGTLGVSAGRTSLATIVYTWTERHDVGFHGVCPGSRSARLGLALFVSWLAAPGIGYLEERWRKSNTLCWRDYITRSIPSGRSAGSTDASVRPGASPPGHLLLGCQCGVGD